MQHPNFETRHPLLSDEQQDMGFDPLHNLNKNRSRGGSLDSTTYSQSESTFLSYRNEWDDLFLHSNYLAHIRQAGINGRLRSSRFRSVCWKLYLEVLPEDKSQWINKTKELRSHYEKIKDTHITNPRKAAGQQDLVVNNPLSQDEGSLWNKFFQDKELRSMIKQDVMRTFPEMRYFQEEDVRTKLTDILFCYARENEQLLYKQGMHELLAPIVFVLHCDHQAFQHASETANPSEEMRSMLNPEFHEHDAYAMFSQLMETAEPWFSCYEREVRKGKDEMLSSIPFARPQDTGPSVAIVTKVNRIQDQLVKKHDIELYMHLNRLEIAPQIYGIRWVRLLYGREFLLQDLLVVWDALFADSVTLDLVDYTFVAMLLYIRDALIASNFQTCLGLLMHYPPVGDIHALLHKALFLRDPKNNPRPVNYQFQQNLDYYKTRGADLVNKSRAKTAPLNINKVSSSLLNFGRKLIAPAIVGGSGVGVQPINSEVHASSIPGFATTPPPPRPMSDAPSTNAPRPLQTQSHPQSPHYRLLKSESMPVHLSKGQTSRTLSSSPSTESLCHGAASPPLPLSRGPSDVGPSSPPLSATKKDSFFAISRSRSHSKSVGKKESDEDLEAQVSFLQGQINDLEAMSKYCGKMMNTHICKIQEVILQEHLEKEDEVLVSLAGLKQIKDILKGSLRFNQSQLEAEENEEITIADDHYTSTQAAMQQQQQQAIEANSHCQHDPPAAAAAAEAHLGQHEGRQGGDSDQDGIGGSADDDEEEEEEEKEEEEEDEQVASSSLGSDGGKNWDDYILVSQDGDLQASEGGGGGGGAGGRGGGGDDGGGLGSERSSTTTTPPPVRHRGGGGRSLAVRMEPEGAAAGPFHDPLMVGTAGASGSSSPDEGSTHSKDSDFTIVNPNDL